MSKLSLRDSITILLLILLSFGMSFGISQYSAKKEIETIIETKARQDLNYMLTYIDKELSQAEQATKTFSAAIFEKTQSLPDTNELFVFEERFLEVNPNISSVMVGFEERVYPKYATEGQGNCIMVVNSGKGFERYLLDSPEFRKQDWYNVAIHKEEHRWSKPYFSPTGHYPITAYSLPIYNNHDHLLGVMGINVRLSRLDSIMNVLKPYPNAIYSVLLNSDLTYIMHNTKDFVLNLSLKSELELIGEDQDEAFLTKLVNREAGKEHVTWEGRAKTIYYAPVEKADCSVMLMIDDETTRRDIAPDIGKRIGFSLVGLVIVTAYLAMLVWRGRKKEQI